MLVQTSLPSSVEAALFYVSDHGKEDDLCERMPRAETWQVCLNCNKYALDWCRIAEPMQDKRNGDDPCGSNCPSSLGQPSTASTMTVNTVPKIVYRRKKLRKNSIDPLLKVGPTNAWKRANCASVISSDAHLSSAEDLPVGSPIKLESEVVKDPAVLTVSPDREPCVLKSDSCDKCLLGKKHDGDERVKNNMQKNLGIDRVNDSCSSSKSNMEFVSDSIETEIDEAGECSSSSIVVTEVMRDDLSEKDFCINFLRSHGLLGSDFNANNGSVTGDAVTTGDSCYHRSCKICGQSDGTLNMLICDHCEEAYHPSCCNPCLKKLPIDEWFCHSCLKKKRKILKETIIKRSPGINGEMGKCRTSSVKGELNPILLMLNETEPYASSVRVGKGFQADVPGWSGPVTSEDDVLAEPLEMDSSVFCNFQEGNLRKPMRLSSIGNWLQCRAVIDRANGTICGKWRRAPLFEVQTDDWECFCAIHWDPAHADCAVPQELEIDQVLKQLKYIEMLRPRLSGKQRKSISANGGEQKKL